jgi:hypothetical protein
MDMKKLLFLLAFTLPLLAQDSTEVKEEAKQKKSWGKSVWMGVQDAEWRKYNSAHNRAHNKQGGMKRGGMDKRDKRREMHKKRVIRSFVRIVVVGGVAYYIGYHQGQHKKHPMKRKPYMGDRK